MIGSHIRKVYNLLLAVHLVEIPDMIEKALLKDRWDFEEDQHWEAKVFKNNVELLSIFNHSIQKAEEALGKSDDSILKDKWKLFAGDITFFEKENWEAIRHAFGQNAYQRAQISAFLRLLDIPIPKLYGPSS